MYIQSIDDTVGHTLAAVSSAHGETKGLKQNVEDGKKLGKALGEELKKLNIERAVFDRNGYLYHGVVKSIADGTREAGIKF
jgi:large subunit ribosomal protein L18